MTRHSFALIGLLVSCGNAEDSDDEWGWNGSFKACDRYAELLCDCAETDDDCDRYRLQFENADADQQDECSARLDQAEAYAETCRESE